MPDNSPTGDNRLDRLIQQLLDSDEPEVTANLDQLLRDNPEIQDAYVQFITLHFLLELEVNPLGLQLEPLCASQPQATVLDALSIQGCCEITDGVCEARADVVAREHTGPAPLHQPIRRRSTLLGVRLPFAASAATLMVAALAAGAMGAAIATYSISGGLWREPGRTYTAQEIAAAEEWLAEKRSEQGNQFGRFATPSVGMWADIRPAFESQPGESSLEQGVVPMEALNGTTGEGFLLALPPGHGIEFLIDAESVKENALVVKRISPAGFLTGHTHSFSSRDIAPHQSGPWGPWRVGRIGYWADFNEFDQTRYYLLCGVNRNQNNEAQKNWSYSSIKPLQVGPNLLYLGWDDGKIQMSSEAEPESSKVDRDYDDVSAIIRIHRPEKLANAGLQRVLASPEPDDSAGDSVLTTSGATLSVKPQQSVVISVTSHVELPCKLRILNEDEGRVWWTYNRTDGTAFYSIENSTTEPVNLRLIGSVADADSANGERCIVHKQLFANEDNWEIGYEHAPDSNASDSRAIDDYVDIRVRCHWVR